jgi:hypothetical protein
VTHAPTWSWLAILLLGVWHGINPGMGWLFAVALGLQERKRRAVWNALLPLALGHGLAIALAVACALAVGIVLPPDRLKWGVAAALLCFGGYRLVRHHHPRWIGMRVGARDLTVWSGLMATAHGAGLMVLPFLVPGGFIGSTPAGHASHAAVGVIAPLLHTTGYLVVTGLVALVVYEKLGLRLLRTMWVNLDLVWGAALIGTACITPLI